MAAQRHLRSRRAHFLLLWVWVWVTEEALLPRFRVDSAAYWVRSLGCRDRTTASASALYTQNNELTPPLPPKSKTQRPLEQPVSSSSLGQSPTRNQRTAAVPSARSAATAQQAALDPVPLHLSSESTGDSGSLRLASQDQGRRGSFHPAPLRSATPVRNVRDRRRPGLAVHTDQCLCERAARTDGQTRGPDLPWEGSRRQGSSGLNGSISPAFS